MSPDVLDIRNERANGFTQKNAFFCDRMTRIWGILPPAGGNFHSQFDAFILRICLFMNDFYKGKIEERMDIVRHSPYIGECWGP